eukprot:12897232-Alexandrium_andersonii.AAC.1
MSASLVGSEMCIRDSATGATCGTTRTALSPAARTVAGGGSAECVSRSTVSYTHLTLPTICSV